MVSPSAAPGPRAADPVALTWLVTGRWATLAAVVGAVIAGRSAWGLPIAAGPLTTVLAAGVFSNSWLAWRVRRRQSVATALAGGLIALDVVLLSWILVGSGGALNPASVFYLVQIVLAALVLGQAWAWAVAGLAVVGYAALFLAQPAGLVAAQSMHPEIALHMQGMWIAFALTALVIAVLVTRLSVAVERRDRALDAMRERHARASRAEALTAVVAGAAHELGTPLATIAVAARELERTVGERGHADLGGDATLIRREIDRCRDILDQMAGQFSEPTGESPRPLSIADVVTAALARLAAEDRSRVSVEVPAGARAVWPAGVVAQALGNLLRNAVQASPPGARIDVTAVDASGDRVQLIVRDRGAGMSADVLARAGEPFFTTKPAGSGRGLGLFVTRASVEHLGGSLALASTSGHGTSATITIPRDVLRRNAE